MKIYQKYFLILALFFSIACGSSESTSTEAQSTAQNDDSSSSTTTTIDSGASQNPPTTDSGESTSASNDDDSSNVSDSSSGSTTSGTSDSSASSDSSSSSGSSSSSSDSGSGSATPCDDDFSLATSSTDIRTGLNGHTEPSGLIWHTGRNSLFVIDDGGTLIEMTGLGSFINQWTIGNDTEAVTIADPNSNFIYIGVERLNSNSHVAIIEYNIATGAETRIFDLYTWMNPTDTNRGLEALTFVPDASSSEGGYFYAALQETGTVYKFELPIISSTTSTSVSFLSSFTPVPGWVDLADMFYDATDDVIYASYDANDTLIAMTTSGSVQATSWSLPLTGQEGIALDRDACVWFIADDSTGELYRYEAP